jgi:hypothetical protein
MNCVLKRVGVPESVTEGETDELIRITNPSTLVLFYNFEPHAYTLNPPHGFAAEFKYGLAHDVVYGANLCYTTQMFKVKPKSTKWVLTPQKREEVVRRINVLLPDKSPLPPHLDCSPTKTPWGLWLGRGGRVGLVSHTDNNVRNFFVLVQSGLDYALLDEMQTRIHSLQLMTGNGGGGIDFATPPSQTMSDLSITTLVELFQKAEDIAKHNGRRVAELFRSCFGSDELAFESGDVMTFDIVLDKDKDKFGMEEDWEWFDSMVGAKTEVPYGFNGKKIYSKERAQTKVVEPLAPEKEIGVVNTIFPVEGGSPPSFIYYAGCQRYVGGGQLLLEYDGGDEVRLLDSAEYGNRKANIKTTMGNLRAYPTIPPTPPTQTERTESEVDPDVHTWLGFGGERTKIRDILLKRRVGSATASGTINMSVELMRHACRDYFGRVSFEPPTEEDEILGLYDVGYEG